MPHSATRRRLASVARELKDSVRSDWRVEGPYQWATVAVIHTGGSFSTLDVYLDSSSSSPGATLALGIPFINGYNPTVGDVVLVGRMAGAARTQRVILGPLETTAHGMNQAGEEFVTDLTVNGLTGATQGFRIVGATPFGPPLTGTFQVGDMIRDMTTYGWWYCTVAGSPGTWVADGGALTSPPAPSVTVNTTGTTTWYYAVFAEGKNGSTFYNAIPSSATKITNGAATPNNTLNWSAPLGVDGSKVTYGVLRSTDGITFTRLGFTAVGVTTFTDNNVSGVAFTPATFNPGGGRVIGSSLFRAAAYRTASYSAVANTDTRFPFDTLRATGNAGGYFSTTNAAFTCPVGGFYRVTSELIFTSNANPDQASIWMKVNPGGVAGAGVTNQVRSGDVAVWNASGNQPMGQGIATEVYCNAGDTIEIWYYVTAAFNGFNDSLGNNCWVEIVYTGS